MKRKKYIILTLILAFTLSGCGHAVKVPAAAESVNETIERSITIPEASVQTTQTVLVQTDFKEISY